MKHYKQLTEEFRVKYESFLTGCDALEDEGLWDKEQYGEMEAFYQNDAMCVILRLIAADGRIDKKEVAYVNDAFGFQYTVDEMKDLYKSSSDVIGASFDAQFREGLSLLTAVNGKIAEAYRELLGLVCEIVIESDNVVTPMEIAEAKRVQALL